MMLGHQGVLAAVSGGVTQGKTIFSTRSYGYALRISARGGAPWSTQFADTTSSAAVAYSVGYPGTISDVQVPYIATNTNASNSVMGPYNFTSGLTLYATIPGLSTAPAYNTGTLAVAASDEILWIWQRLAAGTVTVFTSVATFAADPGEGHIQLLGSSNTIFSDASSTRYGFFTGVATGLPSVATAVAQAEIRVSAACVLSRWETQVTNNPRTTDSTIFLTVNGVTVHSFTLAAGTTPTTIATPGTVLAAGDRVAWGCTNGAGSGSINMGSGLTLRNLTEAKSDVWASVAAYTLTPALYIPILTFTATGVMYPAAAVYNSIKLGYAATLAIPQVYVQINTSTVPCTIRLLVNGVASGVGITIPVGSGAGWITGTGSVTVTSTDDLVWEALGPAASGGAGTLTAPTLGVQIQYLSG